MINSRRMAMKACACKCLCPHPRTQYAASRFFGALMLVVISVLACGNVLAQDAAMPASPYLSGDAKGARAVRGQKGFTHDLLLTNYYQGSVSGPQPRSMEFGGRVDVYLNFDAGKLWGWEGGGIASHIEYRYGDGSIGQGGTFLPTNTISVLPLGYRNTPVITSLHVTQIFAKATLLAGKINAVDLLAASPMLGGRGIDGFSNIEFVAPISGVVPPVSVQWITAARTDREDSVFAGVRLSARF